MKPDQYLHDVFSDAADAHPDPAEVLDAVHQRLNRNRLVGLPRAASAVGAAAAVAAVAVTATALADRSSGHHGEAAGAAAGSVAASSLTTAAASVPGNSVAVSTAPHASATAGPPLPGTPVQTIPSSRYDYSTIAAGWLPGPARQVQASNQPGFEERDYDVNVDHTDMDVIIYLENGPLPSRTEAGSNYREITINGHPAREFIDDVATIVAVDLGNGKIAYAGPSVTATNSRVTTSRITDIAVHVVQDMQFDRHDPIPSN